MWALASVHQWCWGLDGDGAAVPGEQPCSGSQDWLIPLKDALLPVPIHHCGFFHAYSAHGICAELLMGLLYLVDVFSTGCKVKPMKSLHSNTTAHLTTRLLGGELEIPTAVESAQYWDRATETYRLLYPNAFWPCRKDSGYFAYFYLGMQASLRVES